MDFHFFYLYYDGEMYYHSLHGLSYQGSNQKQKYVKVKPGIGLTNLQRRILKAMGLDHSRHKISIVYRAPQQVVDTQVFYNSLQLSGGTEVKMTWEWLHKWWLEDSLLRISTSPLLTTRTSPLLTTGIAPVDVHGRDEMRFMPTPGRPTPGAIPPKFVHTEFIQTQIPTPPTRAFTH